MATIVPSIGPKKGTCMYVCMYTWVYACMRVGVHDYGVNKLSPVRMHVN
jgi:hypothetical protein